MTFQVGAWAVDGNTEDAVLLRQMLWGSTLGSQGTVGHLDCIVTANSPATSGINIGSGQVVILGQEVSFQGSYFGINLGTDSTLTIAPTGGSPRSDMVCVQVKDPTFAGSPWGNPASGQIIFPVVISNVGAGATLPPGGISAIPLARIDMPASTSTVQPGYITDLRQVANPQRSTQMFAVAGSNPGTSSDTAVGAVPWPPGASWTIPCPSWATKCVVFFQVNEALYQNVGNGVARGFLYVALGSGFVFTPQSLYSMNAFSGGGRHTIAGGSTVNIPAGMRGTSLPGSILNAGDGTNTGTLFFDEGSSATLLLEFYQGAALS